jgi:hypothetical protein
LIPGPELTESRWDPAITTWFASPCGHSAMTLYDVPAEVEKDCKAVV